MIKIVGQIPLKQLVRATTSKVKAVAAKLEPTAKLPEALKTDVAEIAGTPKTISTQNAVQAAAPVIEQSMPDATLNKILTQLGEKKLFNKEILAFLTKDRSETGEQLFNPVQRSIISAAVKKVNRLKNIAHKLADDGKRAEKEAYEEIKALFGPKYGNNIEHRAKSKESTFDKLVNHTREEIDKFRNELYKEHFKGNYKKASDADKQKFYDMIMSGKIEMTPSQWKKLEKIFARTKQEFRNSRDIVMDQVGTRLLLPTGSKKETEEVTEIIEKAIKSQKIRITRVSNYSKDGIKPYVSNKRIAGWQELDHRIPTLVNYDKSKDNGYTTFQMNIIHKNGILGEFQMRSRRMNIVCNGEHTFYDLLENKDITKGVPELKEYYEKSGVLELVEEIKKNSVTFNNYMTYIRDSYKKTRDTALGAEYPMPVLSNYIDPKYELLSLENLCRMADEVLQIQKKYPQVFG